MNRIIRSGREARAAVVLATIGLIAGVAWPLPANATQASPTNFSVCAHGCSYQQVSTAVAVAPAGSTIQVHPGTYRGGFDVPKSVTIIGAGAGSTVILGGGPVLTIGVYHATSEPTVVIRGITVTGGITRGSVIKPSLALGGGIFIPPGVEPEQGAPQLGASLTLIDSVVTHNTASVTQTEDAEIPCPGADCRFGLAGGGGIDSWGSLTIDHSRITDNVANGLGSDADGGGVAGQRGPVVINNTVIAGNQALATVPNGRFAEGGGVMMDLLGESDPGAATLAISASTIDHNSAILHSDLPASAGGQNIDMDANGGGIHVGDGIATTVQHSTVNDNVVVAVDPSGEPYAVNGAMTVGDSALTMSDTTMDGNSATTVTLTSADSGPGGGVLEVDGAATITGSHVDHNSDQSTSLNGVAAVYGGVAVFNFNNDPEPVTISDSTINGNVATGVSKAGQAVITGGGVFNNSLLTLDHVQVSDNALQAYAPSGSAEGGGIWNGVDLSGPPVTLTLQNSSVTGNVLIAAASLSKQGGGLYTTLPVTISSTRISDNQPNQCQGCS